MANGDNDLDDFLNKKGISNKAETATADVVEEKVEVEEEVSTSNNDLDSFLKKKGIGEGVKKKDDSDAPSSSEEVVTESASSIEVPNTSLDSSEGTAEDRKLLNKLTGGSNYTEDEYDEEKVKSLKDTYFRYKKLNDGWQGSDAEKKYQSLSSKIVLPTTEAENTDELKASNESVHQQQQQLLKEFGFNVDNGEAPGQSHSLSMDEMEYLAQHAGWNLDFQAGTSRGGAMLPGKGTFSFSPAAGDVAQEKRDEIKNNTTVIIKDKNGKVLGERKRVLTEKEADYEENKKMNAHAKRMFLDDKDIEDVEQDQKKATLKQNVDDANKELYDINLEITGLLNQRIGGQKFKVEPEQLRGEDKKYYEALVERRGGMTKKILKAKQEFNNYKPDYRDEVRIYDIYTGKFVDGLKEMSPQGKKAKEQVDAKVEGYKNTDLTSLQDYRANAYYNVLDIAKKVKLNAEEIADDRTTFQALAEGMESMMPITSRQSDDSFVDVVKNFPNTDDNELPSAYSSFLIKSSHPLAQQYNQALLNLDALNQAVELNNNAALATSDYDGNVYVDAFVEGFGQMFFGQNTGFDSYKTQVRDPFLQSIKNIGLEGEELEKMEAAVERDWGEETLTVGGNITGMITQMAGPGGIIKATKIPQLLNAGKVLTTAKYGKWAGAPYSILQHGGLEAGKFYLTGKMYGNEQYYDPEMGFAFGALTPVAKYGSVLLSKVPGAQIVDAALTNTMPKIYQGTKYVGGKAGQATAGVGIAYGAEIADKVVFKGHEVGEAWDEVIYGKTDANPEGVDPIRKASTLWAVMLASGLSQKSKNKPFFDQLTKDLYNSKPREISKAEVDALKNAEKIEKSGTNAEKSTLKKARENAAFNTQLQGIKKQIEDVKTSEVEAANQTEALKSIVDQVIKRPKRPPGEPGGAGDIILTKEQLAAMDKAGPMQLKNMTLLVEQSVKKGDITKQQGMDITAEITNIKNTARKIDTPNNTTRSKVQELQLEQQRIDKEIEKSNEKTFKGPEATAKENANKARVEEINNELKELSEKPESTPDLLTDLIGNPKRQEQTIRNKEWQDQNPEIMKQLAEKINPLGEGKTIDAALKEIVEGESKSTVEDSQIPVEKETFTLETEPGDVAESVEVLTNKDGSRTLKHSVDGKVVKSEKIPNELATKDYVESAYKEVVGESVKIEGTENIVGEKSLEKIEGKGEEVVETPVKKERGRKQVEAGFKRLDSGTPEKPLTPEQKLKHINNIEFNVSKGAKLTAKEQARIDKLKEELKEEGYEIDESVQPGKKWDAGMNVEATFKEDPTLAEGELIIEEVVEPQVNKDGKLIKAAKIKVRQGTKEVKGKEEVVEEVDLKEEMMPEGVDKVQLAKERAEAKAKVEGAGEIPTTTVKGKQKSKVPRQKKKGFKSQIKDFASKFRKKKPPVEPPAGAGDVIKELTKRKNEILNEVSSGKEGEYLDVEELTSEQQKELQQIDNELNSAITEGKTNNELIELSKSNEDIPIEIRLEDQTTPSKINHLPKEIELVHLSKKQKDISPDIDLSEVPDADKYGGGESFVEGLYLSDSPLWNEGGASRLPNYEGANKVKIKNDGLIFFDDAMGFESYVREKYGKELEGLNNVEFQKKVKELLVNDGVKGVLSKSFNDWANELVVLDPSIIISSESSSNTPGKYNPKLYENTTRLPRSRDAVKKEQEFIELNKPKQDAVQESSTKKVDVQQQAKDGKAVGKGNTKVEKPTKKVKKESVQTKPKETKNKISKGEVIETYSNTNKDVVDFSKLKGKGKDSKAKADELVFTTPSATKFSSYGKNKFKIKLKPKKPYYQASNRVWTKAEIKDLKAKGYDAIITHFKYKYDRPVEGVDYKKSQEYGYRDTQNKYKNVEGRDNRGELDISEATEVIPLNENIIVEVTNPKGEVVQSSVKGYKPQAKKPITKKPSTRKTKSTEASDLYKDVTSKGATPENAVKSLSDAGFSDSIIKKTLNEAGIEYSSTMKAKAEVSRLKQDLLTQQKGAKTALKLNKETVDRVAKVLDRVAKEVKSFDPGFKLKVEAAKKLLKGSASKDLDINKAEEIVDEMTNALEKVGKQSLIKGIKDTIKKGIKPPRPTKSNPNPKPKISPEAIEALDIAKEMLEGVDLNKGTYDQVKAIAKYVKEIQTKGKADKEVADKAKRAEKSIVQGTAAESLYKDVKSKELKTEKEVEDFLKEGKGDNFVLVDGKMVDSKFIKDNPGFDYSTAKGYEKMSIETTNTIIGSKSNTTNKQGVTSKQYWTGLINKSKTGLNPLKGVKNIETLLKKVKKGESPAFKKMIDDISTSITRVADYKVEKRQEESKAKTDKIFKETFGSINKGNKLLNKLAPEGIFKDRKGVEGKEAKIKASNDVVVDLYISGQVFKKRAAQLRESARNGSKTEKAAAEKKAKELENILENSGVNESKLNEHMDANPQLKEFAKKTLEYYKEMGKSFEQAAIDATGQPFLNPDYYPITRAEKTKEATAEVADTRLDGGGDFTQRSAMVDRLKSADPYLASKIDVTVGVREKMNTYIEQMTHAETYIPISKKINQVINNTTKAKIKKKLGKTDYANLMDNLDAVIDVNYGKAHEQMQGLQKLNRLGVVITLAGKPGNFIKQLTSATHWGYAGLKDGITTAEVWAPLAELPFSREYQRVAKQIITSPYVRNRIKKSDIDPALKTELLNLADQPAAVVYKKIEQLAMSPIILGDIAGVLGGGVPYAVAKYKKSKTTKKGEYDAKAFEEAYMRFREESSTAQQSGKNFTTGKIQRTALGKLLTTYKTSQTQAVNKTMQGWMEMTDKTNTPAQRRKGFFQWQKFMRASLLFQAVGTGFAYSMISGEATEEDQVEQQLFNTVTETLNSSFQGMGVGGYVPSAIMNILQGKPMEWNLPPLVGKSIGFLKNLDSYINMLDKDYEDLSDFEKEKLDGLTGGVLKNIDKLSKDDADFIKILLSGQDKNYRNPLYEALIKGEDWKRDEYKTFKVEPKDDTPEKEKKGYKRFPKRFSKRFPKK